MNSNADYNAVKDGAGKGDSGPRETVKCVIIGDGNVGKTAILMSYTKDQFNSDYIPTVFDNYTVNLNVANKSITLSLWDTAGQEEYQKLRHLSYSGTDLFLITFAVDNKSSFMSTYEKWYPEVHTQNPEALKIFIGNKVDLRVGSADGENTEKFIFTETARKVLEGKAPGAPYFECSALTQEGVKEIFDKAILAVLKKREKPVAEKKPEVCCSIMQKKKITDRTKAQWVRRPLRE